MNVNPLSDVDTESETDDVMNTGSRAAYKKLRKRLDEVEESEKRLMDFVTMLDDKTRHLAKLRKRITEIEHSEKKIMDFVMMLDDRTSHLVQDDDHATAAKVNSVNSLEQEEDDTEYYPDDSYSFLALHGPIESPRLFWYAIVVFLFQMSLQTAVVMSIVFPRWSSNEIIDGSSGVFAGDVEAIVKIVQILSIIVHVIFPDYSMDDLITAVNLFPDTNKKCQEDVNLNLLVLSSVLRFLQGLFANIATFYLVFTSLTAKEVILNFAAMNLISVVDNAGFAAVIKGYFGEEIRNEALILRKKRLPDCIVDRKQRPRRTLIVILSTFILMTVAGIVFVFVPQSYGRFLTKTVRFQIEGQEQYNGCYIAEEVWRFGTDRPIYNHLYGEKSVSTHHQVRFAYCKIDRIWYLFEAEHADACRAMAENNVIAHSLISNSFEIKTTFSDEWFSSGGVPLEVGFSTAGVGVNDGCGKHVGDGYCDEVLNTAEFNYDGGDCCAATCRGPFCGLDTLDRAFGTELVEAGDGYRYCSNPDMVNVYIKVNDVIPLVTYKTNIGYINSAPPLLRFDCDGVNYLMVSIQEDMKNKTELIKVRDGAKCEVLIRAGHAVDIDLFQSIMMEDDDNVVEMNILGGVINGDYSDGKREFRLIPTCYLRKLSGYIDVDTVYLSESTPQRKAIDWLLHDHSTSELEFECANPFLMERYALAVAYLSAKYPSLENVTSSSVLGLVHEDMALHPDAQCRWSFVTCHGGHVTDIYLIKKSLSGTIATEIALLPRLRVLDLVWNKISSTIPTELGTLLELEFLWITLNQLSGTIPSELGKLTNLERLHLNGNRLAGTIPSELGMLTNLRSFYIFLNQLDGTIPSELGMLSDLGILKLGDNELTGDINPIFCDTPRNYKINVDCDKVYCTCCFEDSRPCDYSTDPTATSPTDSPLQFFYPPSPTWIESLPTSLSPPSTTTSVAPTVTRKEPCPSANDYDADGCSICGKGKSVQNATGIVKYRGFPYIQCQEWQALGVQGYIRTDVCQLLPSLAEFSICECA